MGLSVSELQAILPTQNLREALAMAFEGELLERAVALSITAKSSDPLADKFTIGQMDCLRQIMSLLRTPEPEDDLDAREEDSI